MFRMMMFAMMLLMWGADLTDTVATTSLPWEMVTHELCAPPSPLHPLPPSASSIDPSIYQLPAANYMVEKIFTKSWGGSSGFCQRRSDLNLDAQYFELVMYVCLWAKMFVPKDCTSVTHALLISLDLYPIWQRPPINSMHQTLIGSILPEKLSSFHGDATHDLGRCVHYESPKLRDRNLSSSSNSCSSWQLWSKSTKTGPLAVARARS